jgi:subtilisin family serine protease
MSTPVVAGAVALMLQANPALTPNLVKAVLQFTAQE